MRYRTMVQGIAVAVLSAALASAAALTTDTAPPPAETRQWAPAAPAEALPAPTVNQPFATRYTLVEVAGKPLPSLIEKEWRCQKEVTAGTLMLSGDGRWRLETMTREVCGDRTDHDRDSEDGIYRTEAGAIRFFDDDGRENIDRGWSIGTDIDLEEFKTGTMRNNGTLTVRLADGSTTLVFRRCAEPRPQGNAACDSPAGSPPRHRIRPPPRMVRAFA